MVFELISRQRLRKAAHTRALVLPTQGSHTAPWPQEGRGSIHYPPPKGSVQPCLHTFVFDSTFTWEAVGAFSTREKLTFLKLKQRSSCTSLYGHTLIAASRTHENSFVPGKK